MKKKASDPTTTEHTLLILGWQPPTINQWEGAGQHWSKKAKLKKSCRLRIIAEAEKQSIPTATGKRRVSLTILLGPRQRGADPDAYFKSLCDALKQAGLLVDDNRFYVELAPVQYERQTPRVMGCKIILTDI